MNDVLSTATYAPFEGHWREPRETAVAAAWRAIAVAQRIEARGVRILNIEASDIGGPILLVRHSAHLDALYPDARTAAPVTAEGRTLTRKEAIDNGVTITWSTT